MLPDVLQNIVSVNMSDKMKELLIAKTLRANQELSQECCVTTLDLGVRWVLEGDRPMVVTVGWLVLQHLKDFQQSTISELLNVATLEKFLRFNALSYNRAEVPALVSWSLSIMSSQAMELAVGNLITDFLRENVHGDINVLVNVSKLLCEHPRCIPVADERARLCEVVTANVAEVPMPKAQPAQVSQLVKQMGFVQALLIRVWKGEEGKSNEQLMFRCLAVLHATIIDRPTEPCPALAAILHLVEPHFIPKYVTAILEASQGHFRTLHTLCQWLCCWPRATLLSPWVLALIDGLETEQHFDVLMEVTLATVEYLFAAIMLPVVRSGVIDVVWRMIASSRHTPQVFHKVVNQVPTVMAQLVLENSDSSRTCLQMVVNMSCAMVAAFPRNDNMYDPLIRALKDCSSFLPPGEFAPENMPAWLIGGQFYYVENHKSRERSSLNRVGLNNLGNTCYMNCVLQALFMTHRFCSTVLDSGVRSQPLLSKLQALFALLLHSQRRAITPAKLLAVAKPPFFQPGYQQDSSEFLTYLLDVLHEQEMHATTSSESTVLGSTGDGGAKASSVEAATDGAMVRWMTEEDLSYPNTLEYKAHSLADVTQATGDDVQQLSNFHSISTDSGIQSVCGDEKATTSSCPVPYESLVQQCFGGRLLISFKCLQCKAESVHTDHFRDIPLAFPPDCGPNHKLHIQDLLDYFTSPEQLSGENQYHCDSCGGLRDAQRTIQILQPPSHLVLTLKRFQFNSQTGERAKLLHWVHCSESIELYRQSYKLYAAVIHSGSDIDTGHYYTLACDETLSWQIFNDSLVAPCDSPPWSPPDTPYILFYARPEEKLQPAVDLLSLPSLHPDLVKLVKYDDIECLQEMWNEDKRRRRGGKQQPSSRRGPHNPDQDSNNGGNPPGSCGGSMNLSHNRFVF